MKDGCQMKKDTALDASLKQCKKYAKRGKSISNSCISLMRQTTSNILEQLNETISLFENNNIQDDSAKNLLLEQLNNTKNELSILPDKITDGINLISNRTINITLFGRTMAGKSTLMEILTHGNGDSIGKGAQRTTLDVREYKYRGMTVTDVPGIAAFGGEDDTRTAFEAAKKADMVLFLITDDAPQPSEAECLKNILSLGKPVICLINVRANIDKRTSMKLFERDLRKKTTDERLNALKTQFLEFGKHFGQSWDTLKFEFVHLKSAFLSQKEEWSEYSEKLYELSRFEKVEAMIAQEVIKNGCYYRLKSYIDAVVVPLTEIADTLVEQGVQNIEQKNTISDKNKKLTKWLDTFKTKGNNTIKLKLDLLKAEIKRSVPSFSETHYNDKKAGEEWNKEINKFHIEERCGEILDSLAKECEEKLNDIYREITAELKFADRAFSESKISMPSIVDGKRIWGWGVTLISGGLVIAALFGVPIVGWVALGVNVFSLLFKSKLFKSKEKKIAEARKKLESQINSSLDKQFEEINKKLKKIFSDELIKKQVEPTFLLLNNITASLSSLADVQKQFSNSLYDKQEEINKTMMAEAIHYIGIDVSDMPIHRIARIAGTCIALSFYDSVSEERIDELSTVINETIYVINDKDNIRQLIADTAGIRASDVQIINGADSKALAARIGSNANNNAISVNRIKLAQQISRLYIMK